MKLQDSKRRFAKIRIRQSSKRILKSRNLADVCFEDEIEFPLNHLSRADQAPIILGILATFPHQRSSE
jgi:hypothetical protein